MTKIDTLGLEIDVQNVSAHRIDPFHGVASEDRFEDLIRAAGEDPTDYDVQDRDDAIEALGIVPGIAEFA